MATNPSALAENIGRITAPDANYPYGSSKDDSTGTAGDGTPYKQARANDIYGMQQALLRASAVVPTGSAETAIDSQILRTIVELGAGRSIVYDDSGVADAYVLTPIGDVQGVNDYFDGMIVDFVPANTSTGSVNITAEVISNTSLGPIDIRQVGGVAAPLQGYITAGRRARLVYRSLPSPHFELGQNNRILVTEFTASDLAWEPQPGTRAIWFLGVAGGGGGGAASISTDAVACGSSGGGGGFFMRYASIENTPFEIVIGAGGLGGVGVFNGSDGGDTTVSDQGALTLIARGGKLGRTSTGVIASRNLTGGEGGIGTGSGGSIFLKGGKGSSASGDGSSLYGLPSCGTSFFGGRQNSSINNVGRPGVTPGSGGAAAYCDTGAFDGGAGAGGVVYAIEIA